MFDDWKDQWGRVLIGLTRVRTLYAGAESISSAEAVYELYAFFLNCWHLRDWLMKGGTPIPECEKVVQSHVHNSQWLQICRELANRTKHYGFNGTGPQ